MKGHIRKRGPSWEYIIDVGVAAAQRCQGCGRRFWVDRKAKRSCPKCGGELMETEERRRSTQAAYATLALSSGVNPRIVSGRLGHSTVAFTLDVYSHVLPQADEEAAVRIAALVRPRI
jgi:integrase